MVYFFIIFCRVSFIPLLTVFCSLYIFYIVLVLFLFSCTFSLNISKTYLSTVKPYFSWRAFFYVVRSSSNISIFLLHFFLNFPRPKTILVCIIYYVTLLFFITISLSLTTFPLSYSGHCRLKFQTKGVDRSLIEPKGR